MKQSEIRNAVAKICIKEKGMYLSPCIEDDWMRNVGMASAKWALERVAEWGRDQTVALRDSTSR